jgi:hypothetical protein
MGREKRPKSFLDTPAPQRDEIVRAFDKGISYEQTQPLSAKGKLLWKAAKRGRPKVGKGARRVLITIEGGLLGDADRAARDSGKNRSQFIADALRHALTRRRRRAS